MALNDLHIAFANCRGVNGVQGRDAYILAVEQAEAQFRNLFWGAPWVTRLHSEEYWRIREITSSTYRSSPLIQAEVERILDWLQEETRALEWLARQEEFTDPGAARAVLDTNVFLHYIPLTDIDWPTELGSTFARVIIPILVIRELDEHKNRGGKKGDRAGQRLKLLRSLTADAGARPVKVRRNTTLQILLEPPGHVAIPQADEEILGRASYLSRLPGGEVTVVTGDLSMQLRAQIHGLPVHTLGEQFRLPLDPPHMGGNTPAPA